MVHFYSFLAAVLIFISYNLSFAVQNQLVGRLETYVAHACPHSSFANSNSRISDVFTCPGTKAIVTPAQDSDSLNQLLHSPINYIIAKKEEIGDLHANVDQNYLSFDSFFYQQDSFSSSNSLIYDIRGHKNLISCINESKSSMTPYNHLQSLIESSKSQIFSTRGRDSNVISVRHAHTETHTNPPKSMNKAGMMWAFLAWIIITLLGFLGLLLIPLKQFTEAYQSTLQTLVALGFGTLVGDAVFHLLNHSLCPHHHHTSDHVHSTSEYETLGKLGVFLFGLLFFFLIEIFLKCCPLTRNRQCGCHNPTFISEFDKETVCKPDMENVSIDHDHDHDHGHVHEHGHSHDHDHDHDCVNTSALHDIKITSAEHRLGAGVPADVTASLKAGTRFSPCPGDQIVPLEEATTGVLAVTKRMSRCSTTKKARRLILVVLFADMCHHIFDGLAIGASFASSSRSDFNDGISTATAVLFHELPHKVGDIALLMRSGYTVKQATSVVVGISSVSLFGIIAGGITSSKYDTAATWINLFTAGNFLYIALVLMMSQMINAITRPEQSLYKIVIAHIIGITSGLGIMLLLVIFEKH